jgi:hypothetical protein
MAIRRWRTSLDKGSQFDALAKLPEEQIENLVKRAAAGETVSARMANGKPKHEPQPPVIEVALGELYDWIEKCMRLKNPLQWWSAACLHGSVVWCVTDIDCWRFVSFLLTVAWEIQHSS